MDLISLEEERRVIPVGGGAPFFYEDFEGGIGSWSKWDGYSITTIAESTSPVYAGSKSLSVSSTGYYGYAYTSLPSTIDRNVNTITVTTYLNNLTMNTASAHCGVGLFNSSLNGLSFLLAYNNLFYVADHISPSSLSGYSSDSWVATPSKWLRCVYEITSTYHKVTVYDDALGTVLCTLTRTTATYNNFDTIWLRGDYSNPTFFDNVTVELT